MKKFILSVAMLGMLAMGAMQLTATSQNCDDCYNLCQDDYYNCIVGGEDERACVADLMDCVDDCRYYCD